MADPPISHVDRGNDRGSALIAVLLLLMLMSALVAALAVSGQTETLISRNQQSAAQAQAAAEGGLNHAVELATTHIFEWQANGFGSVEGAIASLLLGPDEESGTEATDADNGSLGTRPGIDETEAIPLGTRLEISSGLDAEYEAFIIDDDETAPDEDGDPFNDTNGTLIIRATGYSRDDTKVVLEAAIGPVTLPAVITEGDLVISGNPIIEGEAGSVHSNGGLTISGNPEVSGDATAAGSYTEKGNPEIGGTASGGTGPIPLPAVRASDHFNKADFVLTSDGRVTRTDGTALCATAGDNDACEDAYGWDFDGSNGWKIDANSAVDGTFYVEGKARISGNPGTPEDPIQISIIAEGSIEISGNPDFTADSLGLLFVTDGDLKISGGLDVPLGGGGQMLVHEQLQISGNATLFGQIIVEDATSVDNLVEGNQISGNPTITYNGGLSGVYRVSGWRDIRR